MANEKRLIDANEAIEKINCLCVDGNENWIGTDNQSFVDHADVIDILSDMPTVDAVEVVHGRWEKRTDVFGFVRCSNCHDCNIYDDWADGKKWNYCPNCGAKMDGGNEDA